MKKIRKVNTALACLLIVFGLMTGGVSGCSEAWSGTLSESGEGLEKPVEPGETDETPPVSTEPTTQRKVVERMTPLSIVASRLRPGQSVKFTTNNLVSTLSSMGDVLAWGNTGVWDSADGIGTWIGKTANTSRYRRLEYDEVTNSWSESQNLHQELIEAYLGHGYDGNAIDPVTGDIYFRLMASNRPVSVYKWENASDSWSVIDRSRSAACCEAIEWWHGRGLVFSDSLGVDLWDGSRWRQLATDGAVTDIGYHSLGEYQPNADVYVFGGGNAGGAVKLYKLDSDDNLTILPPAPFALGNGATTQGILVQDPGSKMYIAMQRRGLAWAELDPIAETWRSLPISGGDPYMPSYGAPNLKDFITIAIPIPEYDVIMFVSQSRKMKSDDVWLYKHSTTASHPRQGRIVSVLQLLQRPSACEA